MNEDKPQDDCGLPDGFSANVLQQMFDLWVIPELRRRDLPDNPGTVRKALVLMRRDQQPEILINDEFVLSARARFNRDLEYEEEFTASDVTSIEWLEAKDVDPDAAWLIYFALPDGRAYLRFDFTYDRAKALKLIGLAKEYLHTAQQALKDENGAPALDAALSATELAVMAQMRLHVTDADAKSKHKSRFQWLITGQNSAMCLATTLWRFAGWSSCGHSRGTALRITRPSLARQRSCARPPRRSCISPNFGLRHPAHPANRQRMLRSDFPRCCTRRCQSRSTETQASRPQGLGDRGPD